MKKNKTRTSVGGFLSWRDTYVLQYALTSVSLRSQYQQTLSKLHYYFWPLNECFDVYMCVLKDFFNGRPSVDHHFQSVNRSN